MGGLDAGGAEHRLASYGTLAPGRPNHHHVRGIPGHWFTGTVRGRLIEEGWGATMGFPALVLDPTGPEIEVQVLESAELPEHWERLDEFEGSGYQRLVAPVMTADGSVPASIYVLAGETPATRALTVSTLPSGAPAPGAVRFGVGASRCADPM